MDDETLRIQTPCPRRWGDLAPSDEGTRYCSECSHHVHDSPKLTRDEAERLARGQGRTCMRLVADEEGRTIFADTPPTSRIARLVLAAGAGLLAACPDSAPDPAPRSTDGDHSSTLVDDLPLSALEGLGYVCFDEEEPEAPGSGEGSALQGER